MFNRLLIWITLQIEYFHTEYASPALQKFVGIHLKNGKSCTFQFLICIGTASLNQHVFPVRRNGVCCEQFFRLLLVHFNNCIKKSVDQRSEEHTSELQS